MKGLVILLGVLVFFLLKRAGMPTLVALGFVIIGLVVAYNAASSP